MIILTSSLCLTNVFASQNDSNKIISSTDEIIETSNDVLAEEGLKAPTADEDLSLKYDKDLVTYSEFCDELPDSYVAETDEDVLVEKYTEKYDYQTCRLIVGHSGDFNYQGAIDSFDMNSQVTLLQYKNESDTKSAYEYYSNCDEIEYVDIDSVYESSSISSNEYGDIDTDTYLSWAADMINTKKAKDYILANTDELQDVVVGVLDTGIRKEHPYISNRFIGGRDWSNDNTRPDPVHESYGGRDSRGHGTQVAGAIVDNTLPNVKIVSICAVGLVYDLTTYNMCLYTWNTFYDYMTGDPVYTSKPYSTAKEYNVDILNISMENKSSDNSTLLNQVCNYATADGKIIIAAAGNGGLNTKYNKVYPGAADSVIAVGSVGKNGDRSSFSNYGERVDIYAPGENITTSFCGTGYDGNGDDYCSNGYTEATGTSFSAPIVSAVCAMVKTMYPNENGMQIVKRVLNSKNLNGVVDMYKALQGETPTVPTVEAPILSLASGTYDNQQELTVTASDNATIYYTDDGSEPNVNSSTIYTPGKVLSVNESTTYKFIAFESGKMVSDVATGEYIIPIYEENGWKMYKDGTIFDYVGEVTPNYDYIVPDFIDGIAPTAFKHIAKSNGTGLGKLRSIILPKSVTKICDNTFNGLKTYLKKVIAPGVTYIGEYAFDGDLVLEEVKFADEVVYLGRNAFHNCRTLKLDTSPFKNLKVIDNQTFGSVYLMDDGYWPNVEVVGSTAFNGTAITEVYMPNAITIGDWAFSAATKLTSVYLPKAQTVGTYAFFRTAISSIYLPEATYIGEETFNGTYVFKDCKNLTEITLEDFPKIEDMPDYHMYKMFENSGLKHLEMRCESYMYGALEGLELEYAYFPTMVYMGFMEYQHIDRIEFDNLLNVQNVDASIFVAPSTIHSDEWDWDIPPRDDLTFYGTEGTWISNWSKENGFPFINISQETALYKDLPEQFDDIDTVLQPDIIGFNRTYQWYANTVADNTTGTPINGATSKKFNPSDYPKAQYYYCICTSTDKGYDPVTIRTGVTKNNAYSSADYSSVESAKANIPTDLSKYTANSVNALNVVLNGINYNLSAEEQSTVDDYSVAIQNAIHGLVLISDTTTTTKPNETTSTTQKADVTTKNTTNDASKESETTTITTTDKSKNSTANKYKNSSKTSPNTGIDNAFPFAILMLVCGFALVIKKLHFANNDTE